MTRLDGLLSAEEIPIISEGVVTSVPDIPRAALELIWTKNPEIIFELAALSEFMKRKSPGVVHWKAEQVLRKRSPSVRNSENLLVLLYYVLKAGRNHLMDIQVKDMISRKPFKPFEVSGNKKNAPSVSILSLTETEATKILRKIDKSLNDGRKSECWHMIYDIDYVEIYFRREERDFVELTTRNLAEILGKSTILRLHKSGKHLELWAERPGLAKRMLDNLAERLFGEGAEYTHEVGYNTDQAVIDFLQAIGKGNDLHVQIMGIEVINAPLANNPTIRLDTQRHSLTETLGQLSARGIDLLSSALIDIREIRVIHEKVEYNIALHIKAKGVVLEIKGYRGPNENLESFRDHLTKKYELSATLGGK